MFLGVDVKVGQLMTIFQKSREAPAPAGARRPPGDIIAFKGTVRIDAWDAQHRVAQGELVESLDVIERGASVGPVGRRYYVVPPAPTQVDLRARVLTSMYPHVIMGRDQVIFIDRGENDGLQPGNRLFVVRRGDAWRQTLVTTSGMASTRILIDRDESGSNPRRSRATTKCFPKRSLRSCASSALTSTLRWRWSPRATKRSSRATKWLRAKDSESHTPTPLAMPRRPAFQLRRP